MVNEENLCMLITSDWWGEKHQLYYMQYHAPR